MKTPGDDEVAKFKESNPKLAEVLLGDGRWVSDQLKLAALFIMAFECLKDYIEDNFKSFFNDGIEFRDGDIRYKLGKSYKQRFDEFRSDTSKNSLFFASCNWFHDMEALTKEDVNVLKQFYEIRNHIGHKLLESLVDEKKPHLEIAQIDAIIALYRKVSNWWIINIEAAIMPENYSKFSDEELTTGTSMEVMLIETIREKALSKL